jgi:predicted AlkP superfamily pyrophosphatase or phosphodiesterase
MYRTAVLNVVGLTPELLGPNTPALAAWAARGKTAPIATVTPAVTCSVQATYLTGCHPQEHGIVGNGWYEHDECEVRFWRQSNKLVQAPKVWDLARARDPGFTCANLFWWYNMYSTADYSVTPRPMYPADGRKLPDVYAHPARLRDELQAQLGTFPLFDFWGPRAGLPSSRWIADAALRVEAQFSPTLSLIYLPHLDYNLQRLGPSSPAVAADLRAIDAVCGELIEYFERRDVRVLVVSEYGIVDVSRPIHLNRVLREHGLLAVREELGRELLDAGASAAFAVADHQVAHVYVNDPARAEEVRALLVATPGVELVLDAEGKRAYHLGHPRAGDFVAISAPDAWFTYYYWLDDERAPDYARTVDIHRKPGYDPAELFIDPAIRLPQLKVGLTLLRKKLGFRTLLDVIPLDASLVRGSHGRVTDSPAAGPLAVTQQAELLPQPVLEATQVCPLILGHVFG